MKKDLLSIQLFIAAIIASALAYSPFVLDFSLTARLALGSLFMLMAVYIIKRTKTVYTIKPDLVLLSYAAWILFTGLSFFWSQNKAESLFEISRLVFSLLIFVFTFYALKKNDAYFNGKLLKLSVIVFLIAMLAGLYQASKILHWDKESLYSITGLNSHKNLYASFLFLNLFFLANGFQRSKGKWKIIIGICIFLSLLFIALLKTKAVWLGIAASVCVYLLLRLYALKMKGLKIPFYMSLAALIIIANIFFLFALKPVINHTISLATKTDTLKEHSQVLDSETERLILWSKSYTMQAKYPLCGVGAGNWQVHFPDATLTGLYRAEDLNYTFQRPHNDFLWILCETGIIGLNLFLLFLVIILLLLIKAIKSADKTAQQEIILCAAFITGYYVISFFDFPKERIEHLTWINMILATGYYHIKKQSNVYSFGSLHIKKPVYNISLIVLFLIFVTSLMRYKGEYYTRKMYDAQHNNDPLKILTAGHDAWSAFYTLDPTSVPVKWYTANANASTGNYADAQKDFISAYNDNPYNRNVLNDLGSACVFNKDIETAKKYYLEAARISPRFDEPKLNLAALYIGEKNYTAAQACLNTLFHDSDRRSNYQKIISLQQDAAAYK